MNINRHSDHNQEPQPEAEIKTGITQRIENHADALHEAANWWSFSKGDRTCPPIPPGVVLPIRPHTGAVPYGARRDTTWSDVFRH